MSRGERLSPVHELAEQAEQGRAAQLGDCERRHAEAERRLVELKGYEGEYQRSFEARARGGTNMRGLREHQMFIARLAEAVRAQQAVVEQTGRECHAARAQWREAAVRAQAIGKVIEKARTEERMDSERRAQREQDEMALRDRVRK